MSIDTLMNWGGCDEQEYPCCTYPVLNFCLYKSTSWIYSIPFGTYLSGYRFVLTIKMNAFDIKAAKTLELSSGLTISGQNLLINTIVDLNYGVYVYDLIGIDPSGRIIPFRIGKVKVCQNVGKITSNNNGGGITQITARWNYQNTNTLPTVDQITEFSYTNQFNAGETLIADFSSFPLAYLGFAEPSSEPPKTKYYISSLDNGNIGDDESPWMAPIIIGQYRFYITKYPTQTDTPVQFKIN